MCTILQYESLEEKWKNTYAAVFSLGNCTRISYHAYGTYLTENNLLTVVSS